MAKTLIEIRAETSQYQQAMRQAGSSRNEKPDGTAFTGCGTSKVKRIRAGRPACKSDRTDIEDRCSKGDRATEWTTV